MMVTNFFFADEFLDVAYLVLAISIVILTVVWIFRGNDE